MQTWSYIKSFFVASNKISDTVASPYNFDLISRYFQNRATKKAGFQIISDETAIDLDLDAVFEHIDYTSSKIGQQWLYAKLRMPEGQAAVEAFDQTTTLFSQNEVLTERCSRQLELLDDDNVYDIQNLIFDPPADISSIRTIYFMTSATVLSLIATLFHPLFLLLFLLLFAVNTTIHYRNKSYITLYLSAVAQLRKAIRTARGLAAEPIIASEFDTSFLKEAVVVERKSRIVGMQGGGNEFTVILWLLLELIKITFNVETILFHNFIGTISAKKEIIHKIFKFIGDIDCAISVARFRRETSTCRPQFTTQKFISVTNIKHPLIDNCTANSLTLDGHSLLLTGSNMSGKTTFIRTLSINALLAETIYTCLATEYIAPYMKIYSSIRITDNINSGTSYYLSEVLRIRDFIEQTKQNDICLFALDELFKGTNTLERIAAGKAVLAYLNLKLNFVCVSTHDAELAELLKEDNYELYHFQEEVVDNKLIFDYQLYKGPQTTCNAIRILELYDYPSEIVNDAYCTQKKLA